MSRMRKGSQVAAPERSGGCQARALKPSFAILTSIEVGQCVTEGMSLLSR